MQEIDCCYSSTHVILHLSILTSFFLSVIFYMCVILPKYGLYILGIRQVFPLPLHQWPLFIIFYVCLASFPYILELDIDLDQKHICPHKMYAKAYTWYMSNKGSYRI